MEVKEQTQLEKCLDDLWISEEIGDQLISNIVDLGGQILYDHYLNSKTQPYCETQIIAMLSGVCENDLIRFEPQDNSVWLEGEEPLPAGNDTWSRATLKIKKQFKIVPKITEVEKPPSISKNSNVSNIKKALTKQYDRKDTFVRQSTTATQEKNSKLKTQSLSQFEEFEVAIQQDEKQQVDEEEENLRAMLEKEIKRKKDEEQRIKNRIKQEEERKMKLQKIQQELKQKDYTFDHKGGLIYTARVNTDKLVPDKYPVKYQFLTGNQKEGNNNERKLGSSKSARTMDKRPQTTQQSSAKEMSSKGKKPPQKEVDFVKMMKSQSVPVVKEVDTQIYIFDQIMLNPGITMKEAGKYKSGAPSARLEKMSVQEYQVLVENKLALPPQKLALRALEEQIEGQSQRESSLKKL